MIVYNVFGSGDSLDYDIVVKVQSLYTIEINKKIVEEYEKYLSTIFNDKPLNCNLVVVKDGIITGSFKGTSDEVNNSVFRTYNLHKQHCDCLVQKLVRRNIEIKIERLFRTILSFCSRTSYRTEVKLALKSNFGERFYCVKNIDFLNIDKEPTWNKNITKEHFLKKSSFQICQLLELLNGNEVYTKKEICDLYTELYPFLYNSVYSDTNIRFLNSLKNELCKIIEQKYLSKLFYNEECRRS